MNDQHLLFWCNNEYSRLVPWSHLKQCSFCCGHQRVAHLVTSFHDLRVRSNLDPSHDHGLKKKWSTVKLPVCPQICQASYTLCSFAIIQYFLRFLNWRLRNFDDTQALHGKSFPTHRFFYTASGNLDLAQRVMVNIRSNSKSSFWCIGTKMSLWSPCHRI